MTALSEAARSELADAGTSQAAWRRQWFGPDARSWHGDACGCPDDRCRGYHHGESEECGCLRALLADNAS